MLERLQALPETTLVMLALAVLVLLVMGVTIACLRSLSRMSRGLAGEIAALRTDLAVLKAQGEDLERDLKLDLATARRDHQDTSRELRREVGERLTHFTGTTHQQLSGAARTSSEQLATFAGQLVQFTGLIEQRLSSAAAAHADQSKATVERLAQLAQASEQRLEALRVTLEQRLDVLRNENATKLDEMRATVDEKLQATLEARLGESFKLVSDRLEQVHRGLGEMQNLATGVGDLKRVLTNVKTRGGWGEVQLGALLGEMLTPGQFESNVETRPGSNRRVEFAVRLPGRGDDSKPCWLPIDCKFPLADWERLQDAVEAADSAAVDAARKALEQFFREQARDIREKYVAPPHTTDFAILFVPTESLYAEMMARPGLADGIQREHRVLLTGPMNLAALLNSLQMGFRTLAIEQRSSEVWKLLGAVKTEFGKFSEILVKTKERLERAGDELEKAGVRSRAIARELRKVEALPEPDATRILGPSLDVAALDEAPTDVK